MRELLLATSIVALAGCASNDVVYSPQYCYTDQTIVQSGDAVQSETRLECTDRPGQQTAIQRAGIDAKCEEFFYTEFRRGKPVVERGVRCEKFNGTWEIININGSSS